MKEKGGGPTYLASAARVTEEELRAMKSVLQASPVINAILDAVGGMTLILNEQYQTVYASADFYAGAEKKAPAPVEGLRPGEILNCVYAGEGPGGCGTSPYCAQCGAIRTVMDALNGNETCENECTLLLKGRDGYSAGEYKIRAAPIIVGGIRFAVCGLRDISAAKRREYIDRVFVHDLNNTLSVIMLWIDSYRHGVDSPEEVIGKIREMSKVLEVQISDQRLLVLAEAHRLTVTPYHVDVGDLLEGLKKDFAARGLDSRELKIKLPGPGESVYTDPALLGRILRLMTTNAYEATGEGDVVLLEFRREDGSPCFTVNNPGRMPDDVARQVFKRSFSTKNSPGRGLGTYSMKLFGENYLKGKVSFETNDKDGTTFKILLPPEGPA